MENTKDCSGACTTCINGVSSCKPDCFDNKKYFECQSKCVKSSKFKDPRKCVNDVECTHDCDKQCRPLWKGIFVTMNGKNV